MSFQLLIRPHKPLDYLDSHPSSIESMPPKLAAVKL